MKNCVRTPYNSTPPFIISLFFQSSWNISYCDGMSQYNIPLEKYLKIYYSSHINKDYIMHCNLHKTNEVNKYCKLCQIFFCSSCMQMHNDHQIISIDELKFDNSQYQMIKKKCDTSYYTITENIKKEKDLFLETLNEEIEKLKIDRDNLIKAYEKNYKTNTQLFSYFHTLFNSYEASSTKYLHYLNIINSGNFNLLYTKKEFISKKEKEKLKNYVEKIDFTDNRNIENQEEKRTRKLQKLKISLHEKCIQLINKCNNTFMIIKNNTQLSACKFLVNQSLIPEGLYIYNEYEFFQQFCGQSLEYPELLCEIIDEKRFALYHSKLSKILIINTKKKSSEKVIKINYPSNQRLYRKMMMKVNDSKMLVSNGYDFLTLDLHKYKVDYFFSSEERQYVFDAVKLKNNNIILLCETGVILYNNNLEKIKKLYELEDPSYTRIFECEHNKIMTVSTDELIFRNIDTFEPLTESYESSICYNNNVYFIKNKIIDTSIDIPQIIIYNCCPFQYETIINIQDGNIKYCNFYYIDDAIIFTLNNIICSMDLTRFQISKMFIVNRFYKIYNIIALPNRRIAVIGDDSIFYYSY